MKRYRGEVLPLEWAARVTAGLSRTNVDLDGSNRARHQIGNKRTRWLAKSTVTSAPFRGEVGWFELLEARLHRLQMQHILGADLDDTWPTGLAVREKHSEVQVVCENDPPVACGELQNLMIRR